MDKYTELRAALDAATPGPWKASEHQWPEQVGCCPLVGRPYSICDMDRKNIAAATSFGTAVYIAAVNPDTIRALLAERDALAAEVQEQARLLGGGAERELRLLAERDALRDALETMVEMVEMNGFGRTYAMDVARAALSQGEV